MKAAIKAEAGLHSLKSQELWARMLIHYSRVLKLVVIALLIPADTSECERVFSLMNDLKMSEHNRINQSALKNTMIWHTIAKGLKCEQVPVELILNEFRALGGIRGRQAHRGADPPKYDHRMVDP